MNWAKKYAPYFYIGFSLLVIFFGLALLQHERIGDGGEYYALFCAWEATFRPWMSPAAYSSYEQLVASNKIAGLVPREWLENAFSALSLGVTSDFNHFWFYSFLAFLFTKALSIIGISASPHISFLMLHFSLLFFLASVSYYFFKWRGLLAVFLMTLKWLHYPGHTN
jgi:hypothetical protein